MASFSRHLLSGSVNGRAIQVAQITTPGTLIHTATEGGDGFYDEIYLWASNVTGSAAVLTIEWGGVSDPADHLVKAYSIAPNSPPVMIASGQVVNGGVDVRAIGVNGGAINITGFVNRIS